MITRRELILGAAGAAALQAQAKYPGVAYRDYPRCLQDHLRGLAEAAYKRRNAEIAKLTTPAAIAKRSQWVRETFWRLVGGQPERTPLNARVVGSFERPGYRLEKVIYEGQPGYIVSANLYLPTEGRPPYPGVLFQMGHSVNGKANGPYQKCCQGLARLGYVVLAFDPMGQGERIFYPGVRSADDQHTYPGKQMLLVGDSATRMQVWDAVRSLDYLASRPEVDPKRLASTGQSGGGTLTMLLLCVDDRLTAAAVSSGNTENFACAGFDPPGSVDDAEQDLIGSGEVGFDRWDLLYPIAPKPLLIEISDRDFFGTYSPKYVSNGWEEFQKLRRVYAVLGHQDRLAWSDTPLPHQLSYYLRLRIYQWFEQHLKGSDRKIEQEPNVSPEDDPQIWVGATGNVVRDFSSTTPFAMTKARLARLRKTGESPAFDPPPADARARVLGSVPSGQITVQAIEVHSGDGVWLPAWKFVPRTVDPSKPVLLILDDRGRNPYWPEGELGERLALQGQVVCAADLRGLGDLRPQSGRLGHGGEEDYAWASMILGRPLLTQRVTDILALVQALGKVTLSATGWITLPAMMAAAHSRQIESLEVKPPVLSFRTVAETEKYQCPLSAMTFGLLSQIDLPDLAAAIMPRSITLATAVPQDEARKVYPYTNVTITPNRS